MILYSGTGHADVVDAAFSEEDVVTVDTAQELRGALDGVESAVLVVDPGTVDVDAIEDVARTADAHVPTVLLTTEPPEEVDFDAVAPRDPTVEDLRTAADRARRVAAYRESVGDLYDRSRESAGSQLGADVFEAREEADRRFADLPPLDSATIDALLRERDEEF